MGTTAENRTKRRSSPRHHSSNQTPSFVMTGGSSSPPRGSVVGVDASFTSSSSPATSIKSWTTQALKRFHGSTAAVLQPRPKTHAPTTSTASSSHKRDRCSALGACDPRYIVDNMRFQGGVHHTQLVFAVFNGRPLSHCCYDMAFTWFRARRGQEFAVIPGATLDWYQPTAEDIGASLLLQVEIDDAVLGCVEHPPLAADPSIRSRVEGYLAAQTAFFTNVRIVPSSSNNNATDTIASDDETWSLLVDDKRVRLACESALIPPLEALYAPSVQMTLDPHCATAFFLTFGASCGATDDDDDEDRHVAHLHVDLHDRRDVIFLVFQALSARAMHSPALADAISTGQSCMLACRTLPSAMPVLLSPKAHLDSFALPWRQPASLGATKARQVSTPTTRSRRAIEFTTSWDDANDEDGLSVNLNSMLLQDVDELLQLTHEFCLDVDDAMTASTSSRSSSGASLATRHAVSSALCQEDDDDTSMQSALELIKAERRALERQLDHLRHHHHHGPSHPPVVVNALT